MREQVLAIDFLARMYVMEVVAEVTMLTATNWPKNKPSLCYGS